MKKRIIFIFLILIVMIISFIDSFIHIRTDEPQEADVIIMLGGGDKGRMKKAAELYHDGYANYVLITPAIDSIYPQSKQYAIELGIHEENIIEETEATSTYTNALDSMEIMKEKKFERALIVTSDYHLKRSKMIFDRVNDSNYDLKYISALGVSEKKWFERNNACTLWFKELYKLWGYRLGMYHFLDVPDSGYKYQ